MGTKESRSYTLQEGPVLFLWAAAGPDRSPSAPCLWPITFSLLFPSPQAMDSPYANGAYSPPYPPAPGAAPHYTGLPQTRGYYCSTPSRTPYPAESTGMYRPSSPAPPWSYAPPDCPAEGSSLRRQHVPGYSPPQVRGRALARVISSPGVGAAAGLAVPGAQEVVLWGRSGGKAHSASSDGSVGPNDSCALSSLSCLVLS